MSFHCVKGKKDGCGTDFGSLSAFDSHRTGEHDYLYSEGARMDPPREDGRRCLTAREIGESDRFAKNTRDEWSLSASLQSARKFS